MILYHTGFAEIREPDIRRGRKNADFGQGFYLSPDQDFSRRWAGERKGCETFLNVYELECDGLKIKRFSRDAEWFDYIYGNRNGKEDSLSKYDVIIGPIANDTIYDLYGITTSGYLTAEQSLKILTTGPVYIQAVIKTDRAAAALHFVSAEILRPEEIASYRGTVKKEEEAYQEAFAHLMEMEEIEEQQSRT